MRKFLFFFLLNPLFCFTQSLYNPYLLYEPSGRMYDLDSLRIIEINFYDSNFNNVLDSSYFNDPLYKLYGIANPKEFSTILYSPKSKILELYTDLLILI